MKKIEIHLHIHVHRDDTNQSGETPQDVSIETLTHTLRQFIESIQDSISRSTVNNYWTAFRSLLNFLSQHQANTVNAELIKVYEHWLRERGISPNTISCYMRSLRSMFSKVGEMLGMNIHDMFDKVYTGNMKTNKRAINSDAITKLKMLELRQGSFLSLVRDIFLFSFYALGMPFVDVAYLRKSQIAEGYFTYYRHKTGQKVTVRLEPCMLDIIRRYQSPEREYVFPVIRSSDPQKAYRQYRQTLNRYNRSLKDLAERAGISEHLTSYVARHTWASVAYSQNVDLPVISKALGHTNPQTTLIYVKEINDKRLDEANHIIISKI